MKNFPFWLVILIIPFLAFLGEAASSHESSLKLTGDGILADFITQQLGEPIKKSGIQVDNISGKSPLFVNLKASICADEKGQTAICQWNFGDGDVGIGGMTSHVFTTPGQYTIVLKVVNSQTGATEIARPVKVVAL